jgi:transcriptional regulator with XRE-family HTH domain
MIHERYIKPMHVHPIIGRLTEIRLAWQLSIKDLAERIGIRATVLGKYERGRLFPNLKTLIRWADVLGYELNLWPKKQGAAG